MRNYFKTVAALCLTAGLLFGCSGYKSKPEYVTRNEAYKKLKMFGQEYYTLPLEDKSITAKIDKLHFEVEVKDAKTGYTLRLVDRRAHPGPTPRYPEYMPFDGIDAAYFNGIRVTAEDKNYTNLKLLEKTFDDAALKVVSSLEKKLEAGLEATEPLTYSGHRKNNINKEYSHSNPFVDYFTEKKENMIPFYSEPIERWKAILIDSAILASASLGISCLAVYLKTCFKKRK